ncbi:MAG: hypothetical protein JST75_17500 [Bacteroidetes bacterium]|nr:hypothetical protein [Bacteroidota bacterium]
MNKMKLFFIVVCVVIGFNACSNSNSTSKSSDTTGDRTLPPPADNSSATNPSLADTAYHFKDTVKTHGDSVRTQKK